MAKKEILNKSTGEIREVSESDFNKMIVVETVRPDGSRRVQYDFSNCVSLAEQHTAHLTDINYLIEKMKPDELASYIAVRNQHRREILNHDFSQEPNMQSALNAVYAAKTVFEELKPEVKNQFRNALEFFKFVDNESNKERLLALGVLTKEEVSSLTPKPVEAPPIIPTP